MYKGKLLLFLSFIAFSAVMFSCNKKKDTIVKIHVRDANNSPVSGATVTLKGSPTIDPAPDFSDDIPGPTTTNSAGEAVFNLNAMYQKGQAGVAVLNIVVSSGSGNGSGIIKVEAETTSEETVFI